MAAYARCVSPAPNSRIIRRSLVRRQKQAPPTPTQPGSGIDTERNWDPKAKSHTWPAVVPPSHTPLASANEGPPGKVEFGLETWYTTFPEPGALKTQTCAVATASLEPLEKVSASGSPCASIPMSATDTPSGWVLHTCTAPVLRSSRTSSLPPESPPPAE